MIRFSRLLNRIVSRKFNHERQFDMWAIGALLYIGDTDDLQTVLTQHPEKDGSFWLYVIAGTYTGIKLRLKSALREV
jgi:hypothetical protein